MFNKIKAFFLKTDNQSQQSQAENDFDALMDEVDKDELALEKLERDVQSEFEGIQGNASKIRQDVDGLMMDEAA